MNFPNGWKNGITDKYENTNETTMAITVDLTHNRSVLAMCCIRPSLNRETNPFKVSPIVGNILTSLSELRPQKPNKKTNQKITT